MRDERQNVVTAGAPLSSYFEYAPNNGTTDRLNMEQAEKDSRRRDRLEHELQHAIEMEKRAGTKVKRAATVLQRWQKTRRSIERRIGSEEVRRIVNRLSVNSAIESEK